MRDELIALARHLLPTMPQFYLVLSSDDPPPENIWPGAWGYTGTALDIAFRPWLAARWAGRGPLVFLDDRQLRSWTGGDSVAYEHLMRATLIHELGHVAMYPIPVDMPIPADIEHVEQLYRHLSTMGDLPPSLPPWHGHEWQFIRQASHLTASAQRAGYPVCLDDVVSTGQYRLPSVWRFADALGNELNDLCDIDIFDLLSVPPPAAFMVLWDDAVSTWNENKNARLLSALQTT